MGCYAILSDIHGNLSALRAVHTDMRMHSIDGLILLGDLIDYGMQSNEVVEYLLEKIEYPLCCNIWGNHEHAIMNGDYSRFSSHRGVDSAKYTASVLMESTKKYLNERMEHAGYLEFFLEGKRALAVHGSLNDSHWKSIMPGDLHGDYSQYDVVFSGHSHVSHMFTKFYEANKPEMRNLHAVTFINPGSVGQPRNHHPEAQYSLLDTRTYSIYMRSVPYQVEQAQSLYRGQVDSFYKERLERGV